MISPDEKILHPKNSKDLFKEYSYPKEGKIVLRVNHADLWFYRQIYAINIFDGIDLLVPIRGALIPMALEGKVQPDKVT